MKVDIGILGKGQLGMLIAQAAERLNKTVWFYEPSTQRLTEGSDWDTPEHCLAIGDAAWSQFSTGCSVYTYESEHVPHELLKPLAENHQLFPSFQAVEETGHRVLEKKCFGLLDIPTAPWCSVSNHEELGAAVAALGLPAILKTATQGYDGKGQQWLRTSEEVAAVVLDTTRAYVLERVIPFDFEFSVIGAQDQSGAQVFYPIGRNLHEGGILRVTVVPANLPAVVEEQAKAYLSEVMKHFRYVGFMTLECFYTNGKIYANELAPRVHNSGHWSIEGANCSQFEQHVRAITGLPLVAVSLTQPFIGMVNLLGHLPSNDTKNQWSNAFWYDYRKAPRAGANPGHEPGRKLGHVTLAGEDRGVLENDLVQLRADCRM